MQRRLAEKRQVKGAIAQLGERLPCTQEVGGSIPPGSTNLPGSPETSSSRALARYAETFDRPKQIGGDSKFQGLELNDLRIIQFWH
jgi:hypothetical protein